MQIVAKLLFILLMLFGLTLIFVLYFSFSQFVKLSILRKIQAHFSIVVRYARLCVYILLIICFLGWLAVFIGITGSIWLSSLGFILSVFLCVIQWKWLMRINGSAIGSLFFSVNWWICSLLYWSLEDIPFLQTIGVISIGTVILLVSALAIFLLRRHLLEQVTYTPDFSWEDLSFDLIEEIEKAEEDHEQQRKKLQVFMGNVSRRFARNTSDEVETPLLLLPEPTYQPSLEVTESRQFLTEEKSASFQAETGLNTQDKKLDLNPVQTTNIDDNSEQSNQEDYFDTSKSNEQTSYTNPVFNELIATLKQQAEAIEDESIPAVVEPKRTNIESDGLKKTAVPNNSKEGRCKSKYEEVVQEIEAEQQCEKTTTNKKEEPKKEDSAAMDFWTFS